MIISKETENLQSSGEAGVLYGGNLEHHYIPKSEGEARLKGCLVLFGFIGLCFAVIALIVYLMELYHR